MHKWGRNIPWAFVTAAAILICTETLVYSGYASKKISEPVNLDEISNRFYETDRLPYLEYSVIQWKVYHILTTRDPQDVVFLGDSSCLHGAIPEIITRMTGLTAWNYGTIGALGIEGHTGLLELFIQHQGAPRIVVYQSTPHVFANTDGSYLYERFANWVNYITGNSALQWPPSRIFRQGMRSFLLPKRWTDEILNTKRGPWPSDVETRQILEEERGFIPEVHESVFGAQNIPFRLESTVIPNLVKLFELSKQYDFQLYVTLNPHPDVYRSEQYLADIETLRGDLEKVAQPYEHVRICDPLVKWYENSEIYCTSCTHLKKRGAERNSMEYAEMIGVNRSSSE